MTEHSLDQIKKWIREHRTEEALQALDEMDAHRLSSAESHYLRGSIFHRENLLPEAVEAFKRALLMDPNFTDAAISLSIIYNDTGHYQQGQAIFEQAEKSVNERGSSAHASTSIVLSKELAAKHAELGMLYRKIQRFDEAASELLKAARLDPANVEPRIELAKTHAQRGNTRLAKEELLKLTKEFPDHANVRVQLALLYYSLGNTVDAQMELNQALLQDPSNLQVKTYLKLTTQASESTV